MGTIFGRSPNMTLALAMAMFNIIVVFQINGFTPTVEQIATVNGALATLIAFIANVPQISAAAGAAAINKLNDADPINNPGTRLANTILNNGSQIIHKKKS